MDLIALQISKWPLEFSRPVGLILRVGIGLSFFVAPICLEHYGFQAVSQPTCHSEHRQDKITELTKSVRQCKGCGKQQSQSAFASKGRSRTSAFCKDCDNKRRRAAHASMVAAVSWDNPAIRFESNEVGTNQFASLLWELLSELNGSKAQPVEQTIDSLLNRRSSINDFVNEV